MCSWLKGVRCQGSKWQLAPGLASPPHRRAGPAARWPDVVRPSARLYLEACAEEDPGDGSLIRTALNDIARSGNVSRLARETGMSREGL